MSVRTEMAISRRIELSEESNDLTIRISAPRYYFHIFFLPVWWLGWTAGGFTLLIDLLTKPAGNKLVFLLLFLCLWLASWIIMTYSWLWMIFGKELVSLRGSILVIKRDIFGLGMTTRIPIAEVTDFYIISGKPSLFSSERSWARLGFGGGMLGIAWRGRTSKFGLKLQNDEAEFLYDKLAPRLTKPSKNSFNTLETK